MKPVFTAADIEDFRAIWRDEFGDDLTVDAARAEAENLLAVVYQLRAIYQRGLKTRTEPRIQGALDLI
jgi:hypothetical protein